MKKFSILLFVAVLAISSAYAAKGPNFLGSWMSEKIIADGQTHMMYMQVEFEKDHKVVADSKDFGEWAYIKSKKQITFSNMSIGKFDGDWIITDMSDDKLVLRKGVVEWHLFKFDVDAVKKANVNSNMQGLWRAYIPATEEKAAFSFVLGLKDMDFEAKELTDYMTSTSKGTWMYNTNKNTITFMSMRSSSLFGEYKVIEHNEGKLTIESKGKIFDFEKLKTSEIQPLTFTYEYIENHKDESLLTPWIDYEKWLKQYQNKTELSYRQAVYDNEIGVFNYSPVEYSVYFNPANEELKSEKYEVVDGAREMTEENSINPDFNESNYFFPIGDIDDYMVVGQETITVEAGTFECTVVLAISRSDIKYKFWMVNNMPGVYAKVVMQKEAAFGEISYVELELQHIKVDE